MLIAKLRRPKRKRPRRLPGTRLPRKKPRRTRPRRKKRPGKPRRRRQGRPGRPMPPMTVARRSSLACRTRPTGRAPRKARGRATWASAGRPPWTSTPSARTPMRLVVALSATPNRAPSGDDDEPLVVDPSSLEAFRAKRRRHSAASVHDSASAPALPASAGGQAASSVGGLLGLCRRRPWRSPS